MPLRTLLALALCIGIVTLTSCASAIDINPPQWSRSFNSTWYQRGQVLDPNQYVLYWSVNKPLGEIQFGVVAKTTSWVGFGLSANGGMKGADVAVLIPKGNGQFELEDRFAFAKEMPRLDTNQNKRLIASDTKHVDGVTHFVFTRKISSCDDEDDFDIIDQPTYVIRAIGSTDNFEYHGSGNRGTARINLLSEDPAPTTPSEVFTVDVVQAPNYAIPVVDTEYTCSFHILPHDRKYHVIAAEPLVKHSLVHHMILFSCLTPVNDTLPPTSCGGMTTGTCYVFWQGWAVGGEKINYPSEAGLPMGENDSRYFLLQIHYDNPDMLTGQVDPGSGFRLTYTTQLRSQDIATLVLGDFTFRLPKGEQSYEVVNECPMECTRLFPHDLTVIGNGFHMHYLGRSSWTDLVRADASGKYSVVGKIGNQPYFDFEHQNPEPAPRDTVIKPGDRLIQHCRWDTSNLTPAHANDTVRFGESTTDEMCFNFIQYYPKVSRVVCAEAPANLVGPFAVCATTDVDIDNLDSLTLADIVALIVAYIRNRPYTAASISNLECTASLMLPSCGNGIVDEAEDCEGGSHCFACGCQEGYISTSPKSKDCTYDWLSTVDGKVLLGTWVAAGGLLIILIILVIVILVRRSRRSKKAGAGGSNTPKAQAMKPLRAKDASSEESESTEDRGPRGPTTPAAVNKGAQKGKFAGSESVSDNSASSSSSQDEDDDDVSDSYEDEESEESFDEGSTADSESDDDETSSGKVSSSGEDDDSDDADNSASGSEDSEDRDNAETTTSS